jgi:hypothetical protein
LKFLVEMAPGAAYFFGELLVALVGRAAKLDFVGILGVAAGWVVEDENFCVKLAGKWGVVARGGVVALRYANVWVGAMTYFGG